MWLAAALAWTLLACYPNPGILFRNLARYRHLPVDPRLAKRMKWHLSPSPREMELFTQSLLTPTDDWALYRVPWYVPTPLEAVGAERGDCEATAMVLASLLAGKGIPYQIRASFTHIWVDYRGRPERKGETSDLAYLEGEKGRWRLHWPRQVRWREVLSAQKEQLWEAMPPARKAILICGWLWVTVAVALARGPAPEGEIASDWRTSRWPWAGRAVTLSALSLAVVTIGAALRERSALVPWTVTDLKEVIAFSLVAGSFLAWVSALRASRAVSLLEAEPADRAGPARSGASARASHITTNWGLGLLRGDREVNAADVAHLGLRASPGGLRPWLLFASLKSGGRVLLLCYRTEVTARAALRRLGLSAWVPILVRAEGQETRTGPDEITLNLRERAARRPLPEAAPRPAFCGLEIGEAEGRWVLRYPPTGPGTARALLGCAVLPVLIAAVATAILLVRPQAIAVWIGWVVATSLLALAIYLALLLKGEIVGRLSGTAVEIGEGELRFRAPDGTDDGVPLSEIEAVEMGRLGETPTIAVVTLARVLHVHSLGAPEHRGWVRSMIERAVIGAPLLSS
jgi:hypothetical protein